jgi:hypothetical protein
MGISLYYEARRERSLSLVERAVIDTAMSRCPVEELIAAVPLPAEEYSDYSVA